MIRWIWNVLISIDQLANAILGGDPDETISSRIGKRVVTGRARGHEKLLARFLNWLDPNHVQDAIEYDEGKKIPRK